MSKSTANRKNKGGAPRGNKNAMIHGLYTRRITIAEDDVLSQMKATDLAGEIAYMRVVAARIAKILENNGLESEATKNLSEETLRTFSSLDRTLTTLLTYVRQYAFLSGEIHEIDIDIDDGKEMARKEHGVYQYLDPAEEE